MTNTAAHRPAQGSPGGAGLAKGFRSNGNGHGERFRDLDAIVLSIEWEISDETMSRFIREVEQLKQESRDDKIIYSCLQLLSSAGVYVKNKKASAHPASINLLHSAHRVLKRMIARPDLPPVEKRRMVAAEVKKFKALQAELIRSRTAGHPAAAAPDPQPRAEPDKADPVGAPEGPSEFGEPPSKTAPEDTVGAVASGPAAPREALLTQAVEEIKQLIRTEMESLRQELRNWHAHSS